MSEIPLNKFEKRDLVIKLHNDGRTYRDIAHIARVSVRDIKPMIESEQKLVNNKRTVKKNLNKKPSISSQSFMLYQEGKKIDEVKVLLDIPFKFANKYWVQYLKSIRLYEAYEFYKDHNSDIPTLLSIKIFLERNDLSNKDIAQVLRTAKDVANLNKTISNLKAEIEKLKQHKNNYSINQNTNHKPILPLGLPAHYYGYYYNY